MASKSSNVFHLAQQSFASGVISPEVANRIDLEKYGAALLTAENCYIRPYGPAYKRGGMLYCADAKYSDRTAILVPFNYTQEVNFMLEIGDKFIRVYKNGTYLGVELTTPYAVADLNSLRFTQSADVMFITSGSYPVKQLEHYSDTDWRLVDFEFDSVYFDESLTTSAESSEEVTVTPSATTGDITLTSDKALFSSGMVGNYIRLTQNVASQSSKVTVKSSSTETSTDELIVGDSWKILTGGTWTGTVTVQRYHNNDWEELRSYQSNDNYNVTESGTVTEETKIRAIWSITSGTCTLTLSRLPYDKTGSAKITAVASTTSASATVVEDFGNAKGTKDYAWGAWCSEFGYPSCATFFQDRLCFAATTKQPYVVWMSRTADYHDFSVEKVSGKVTDDSAIAASFISRKQHKIMHLMAGVDLIVLTEGNEWMISGGEVVTPSNMTPRMQTTRGCSYVEPLMVGNRLIFVQGRGSTVRDMGYTYETDSYVGNELTILAQHLVRDYSILDMSYKQEPNSMVYCVRSDGTMICLSYIKEQDVYAWSTMQTDGTIEAVCCVGEGDEDYVYVLVKRGNKRYIEKLVNDNYSDVAQDYIMLDSAVVLSSETATTDWTCTHLAGKTVDVLADGRVHADIEVASDGTFTLEGKVSNVTVGLRYTMNIELPNAETTFNDGTSQGRNKFISRVTLRLRKSLGGNVGASFALMDKIKYDEPATTGTVAVFTGDKYMSVPLGGYDKEGRVCIMSNEPYPFMVMAVIRLVTFGGD